MPLNRQRLLTLAVLFGVALPFVGKPVHIDDANFLVLAEGAAADLWRPHAIEINWQGTTERAFDVLSNPPGIGWWLAPVAESAVWLQHLWMLPWLLLAAWGAWVLGERFGGRPAAATLLIVGAPGAVLATHALTPDLPLLACTLAGMAGLTREAGPALWRRWPWALLLGVGALFRYSGAVFIVVAAMWPLIHHGRVAVRTAVVLALAAAVPLELLFVHDALAYGEVHLLAMTGFQGIADTPRDIFRKGAASVAMLGAGLVLPVLCWSRKQAALLGLVAGCVLGGFAASLSEQTGGAALITLAACSAGGAVLFAAVPMPQAEEPSQRFDRDAALLVLWIALGLLFMLKLRFTATRYLLPFFPPLVLLGLRMATPRLVQIAVPLTLALSLLLGLDDLRLAQAQLDLAKRANSWADDEGPGVFAGHWGWQHHLELRGWTPLEEDAPIPRATLFAASRASWPQEAAESCLVPLDRLVVEGPAWLPRVHSWTGAANFHASMVSATPPIETYAPWTFSPDPYDVVMLFRGCRGEVGGAVEEVEAVDPNEVLSLDEAIRRASDERWEDIDGRRELIDE